MVPFFLWFAIPKGENDPTFIFSHGSLTYQLPTTTYVAEKKVADRIRFKLKPLPYNAYRWDELVIGMSISGWSNMVTSIAIPPNSHRPCQIQGLKETLEDKFNLSLIDSNRILIGVYDTWDWSSIVIIHNFIVLLWILYGEYYWKTSLESI